MPRQAAAVPSVLTIPTLGTIGHPSDWRISDPSHVSVIRTNGQAAYVEVAISPSSGRSTEDAEVDLPLEKIAGSILEVSVEARVKGVTKPDQPYNGVKAMLHVTSTNRSDSWDQADANGDTFPVTYDWKQLSFRTPIPRTVTHATLVLGLQGSTGTADFRNVSIKIVRQAPIPYAHTAKRPVYTGHSLGALRGVMISPDITPTDIDTLKQWNVNLVRWQLTWGGFPQSKADTADQADYDVWLNSCLQHLDDMLPYFKKAHILVVLDLHTPPGGSDAGHVDRVFTDALWQKHFIDCWRKMATKYRGEKQVWGYDLFNEPIAGNVPESLLDWHDLAEKTALMVRRIDSAHAIIIEPDPGGSPDALPYFEPLKVPGVVYSVHMYEPHQFTHQGVFAEFPIGPAYPGVIAGEQWNKDRIRQYLQPVADYAAEFHVSIYIGEFSAIRWAKGADKYLADVIDVCESNGWDWSYHAFREWQGWSAEVGDDKDISTPSKQPTDRLRVLLSAFAKNSGKV